MLSSLKDSIYGFLKDNKYFELPLLGVAPVSDPIFERYKEVVHPEHMTPETIFNEQFGEKPENGSVVVWILPVKKNAVKANRIEKEFPSREWAQVRNFGEMLNDSLCRYVEGVISDMGYKAVAPRFVKSYWADYDKLASTWSERHAAYAAGLGTFGLHESIITEAGSAVRIGSVVTDMIIEPTLRNYDGIYDNCLHYSSGKCGACIRRCPAGAMAKEGRDKLKCHEYTRNVVYPKCNPEYSVDISGCGLCLTKVPCEGCIPSQGSK